MQEIEHNAAREREESMTQRRAESPESEWADGYDEIDPEDTEPEPLTPESRRRMVWGIVVIAALGLTAVIPPLINVNRYRRRIATSISASLGRPVHLDSVTLNVLPLPGFTLTNFVVSEDPSFGSEPVIRANTVRATLRMRSLWHRRVEFSKIALDEPSVNLVRRADGRWNIESILLQASRMPVAPTEQKVAAGAGVQRFPYIEATGARVNLKEGLEKKPISLTDAEFALWLPEPAMWRLRLEAHPTRTDTAAADSGLLRVEGTFGKAESVRNLPIDLHAEWSAAPLGAASWVLMGHDGEMRGEMTLRANVKGTVGSNAATARLELRRLRRADFVPVETLDVNVDCKGRAEDLFHRLTGVACTWPGAAENSGLTVTGEVPDTRNWRSAKVQAKWKGVPVSAAIAALRVASSRDLSSVRANGVISGELVCCESALGHFEVAKARLAVGDGAAILDEASGVGGELAEDAVTLAPVPLSLGGPQPAVLAVEADKVGVHVRLAGVVLRSKLVALGKAVPQFGEGLEVALPPVGTGVEEPVRIDLAGTRVWGGSLVWGEAGPMVVKKGRRR